VANSKRAGTFMCWLFGHKFIWRAEGPSALGSDWLHVTVTQTDYCVRCGSSRAVPGAR
jgi:hypothetical protein